MNDNILISVHLPKTAGSSFAQSLRDHYGEKLSLDYEDLPLHKNHLTRHLHASKHNLLNFFKPYDKINAIHGHFLPYKYLPLIKRRECTFITWLRDPAERIASQYYYMKRSYTKERADKQLLLKKMMDEDWSFERFCLANELQNTYTQFFWKFPIERFQFIGVVENYQSDLEYFSKNHLFSSLQEHKKNQNCNLKETSYFEETSFKKRVLEFHSKDYALYKDALNKSNNRKTTDFFKHDH